MVKEHLGLRVTAEEKRNLKLAALLSGASSVSDFIRVRVMDDADKIVKEHLGKK